jgi:hypothetical protein
VRLSVECARKLAYDHAHTCRQEVKTMHIPIQPLVALVAGILILVRPRLLNYIVAIYLIVIGVLGLARF